MPDSKNVMFFGRGVIAERCLSYLLDIHSLKVRAVCSNKDPQQFWWKSNQIYRVAHLQKIPFVDNRERNEDRVLNLLEDLRIGTIISVQHTWILPEAALKLVCGRAYNLHNAALPAYRGFYTIAHEIANNELLHTTTIHKMALAVDTGNIIDVASQKIFPYETAKTTFWKSVELSANLFHRFIPRLACGFVLRETPLKPGGRFYSTADFHNLKKELVDKNTPKARKERITRALEF